MAAYSANKVMLSCHWTFLFSFIFVHLSNSGGLLAATFKFSGHSPLQTSLYSREISNLKHFSTSPISSLQKGINKHKYRRRSVKTHQQWPDFNVKQHIMDTSIHKKEETGTLDYLLEVMGPHLFLVPFALQTLPFALPALPISYLLSRYEPAEIGEGLREVFNHINKMMVVKPTPHTEGNATVISDHHELLLSER